MPVRAAKGGSPVFTSRHWAALAMVSLLLLTACGPGFFGTPSDDSAAPTTPFSVTTLPPTPPPRPAVIASSPSPAAVAPATLADPLAFEQRLAALRFDVKPDGVLDDNTRHAVIALQKLTGLPRTGKPAPDVTNALASFKTPPPLVPGGSPNRVEIDLTRQVIFLYMGGQLERILPTSTGSGKRYCEEGKCGTAVTPRGNYQVERRIAGWRKSDLGRLYNPLYFKGGIAIHGYPSVPTRPASHGCVRIPMGASTWFFQTVPNGTPVHVV